jgi:hypothetical protein
MECSPPNPGGKSADRDAAFRLRWKEPALASLAIVELQAAWMLGFRAIGAFFWRKRI